MTAAAGAPPSRRRRRPCPRAGRSRARRRIGAFITSATANAVRNTKITTTTTSATDRRLHEQLDLPEEQERHVEDGPEHPVDANSVGVHPLRTPSEHRDRRDRVHRAARRPTAAGTDGAATANCFARNPAKTSATTAATSGKTHMAAQDTGPLPRRGSVRLACEVMPFPGSCSPPPRSSRAPRATRSACSRRPATRASRSWSRRIRRARTRRGCGRSPSSTGFGSARSTRPACC